MTQNRIRIVDVADALGLSTATVSKVIHGKTEKISDETVKRVQQELERSGYIPNMVGKRLGRKEYDEAYKESKKIMYAGLFGAVAVSALLIVFAGVYTGLYRVDDSVKALGKILLIVFALYAPVKVENMILGGGIIRSGGNTKIIMVIDIVGTWCIGIPLCLLAAYVFKWGIVGVYTLLTTEEIFRLIVSFVIFKRRKWMISLS